MSQPAAGKKLPLVKLAALAVAVAAVGLLLLRGVDIRAWVDRGMTVIRDAGPVAFFTAMTLAPAAGVPMLTFTLTAGPAFAPTMGMPLVVVISLACVTVNLAITYLLARHALRPVLKGLMTRLGYQMLQVPSGDVTDLIILLRVTPGIPFFAQNYMLGLAQAPFAKYCVLSTIIASSYSAAFVIFGNAVLEGKGRTIMLTLSVLAALTVATHLVRRHYGKRNRVVT